MKSRIICRQHTIRGLTAQAAPASLALAASALLVAALALVSGAPPLASTPALADEPPVKATQTYTTTETVGTGTKSTVLSDREPINMATGELFFFQDLLRLGGPLPLGYRLYYGSQTDSKRYPDGLTSKFVGSQRGTLARYDTTSPPELFFEPGLGDEIGFVGLGGEWVASGSKQTRYQVVETADWYYIIDPIQERVWTFRKPGGTALSARVQERATLTPSGGQGTTGSHAGLAISGSGRYLAFFSDASDLVSGDTNAVADVFLRDRGTGTTTRASVSSAGEQGNGASEWPSISQDSRYVAFRSNASNLVLTDTNGLRDAFVHDRQTGQTTRVNVSSAGTEANGSTSAVAISGDGRYVAFTSSATNLAAADTDATVDVYVHDRQTGQTVLVSVRSDGTKGNDISSIEAQGLSHDGRFVAFYSYASNLVLGDTNGTADCFVHDRQTGQTTRVSVSSAGGQADDSSTGRPSISPDGRYVAFTSSATNLVAEDTNGYQDVFLHDRATGQTVRASVDRSGNQGNDWVFSPTVSSYGRYVAFDSFASNLVEGDTNNNDDLFVAAKGEPGSAFLVRAEDRNGNALAYQNPTNIADRGPDSVSDGLGRTLVFTYTTVGGQPYLTQIGDQAGRIIGLGYENNPADNPGAVVLRAITDTLGNATRFAYGGSQRVISQTLPLGNTPYTQTYSGTTGVVKTQTDAYSNTTQVRLDRYTPYTDPDSQFTVTYPDGATSVFTHTHGSRMAKGWADQTGRPVAFGSDATRDQFASVTDRLGGHHQLQLPVRQRQTGGHHQRQG